MDVISRSTDLKLCMTTTSNVIFSSLYQTINVSMTIFRIFRLYRKLFMLNLFDMKRLNMSPQTIRCPEILFYIL